MQPDTTRSTLFPYTTLFRSRDAASPRCPCRRNRASPAAHTPRLPRSTRSEEHTSELQSHVNLVCRLLLEKKNKTLRTANTIKEHRRVPIAHFMQAMLRIPAQ